MRFGRAQDAVYPPGAGVTEARCNGRDLVAGFGWRVHPSAPALGGLGAAFEAVRDLSEFGLPSDLRPWADAAWLVAQAELATLPSGIGPVEQAEHVALGTALFARILLELRLLAEQAVSAQRPD